MNATEPTCLQQIHIIDRQATSGGRFRPLPDDPHGVEFPCGSGYHVRVTLNPLDLWDVTRLFRRGGRDFPKGTLTNVHAEELSEAVYRAGCFRDPMPEGVQ